MTIRRVERYVTEGLEFPTFQKAVDYRENRVEEFLRGLPGFQDIPAKQRILFVTALLAARGCLRELLDYSDCEDNVD